MKNTFLATIPLRISVVKLCIFLVFAMYFAGLIGLSTSWLHPFFEPLIPLNLIASLAILLAFHTDWNRQFVGVIFVVALVGFGVEVAGVQTKQIFGDYQYDHALGFKWLGVPVVIACNWLLLVYATSSMAYSWRIPKNMMPLVAALLMVGLDVWIEPVAIRYGFWSWDGQVVPLQNYVAWFLISWGLTWLFLKASFCKQNVLAMPLYVANLLFFVAHNLIFWLNA